MIATEEIRRLLDERGVEYETCDKPSMRYTCWRLAGYDMMNACFEEIDGLVPSFYIRNATPEQAIAATLGPWECRITDNGPWGYPYVCSACGASFDQDVNNGEFNYCPNCGRKVVDE